MKQKDTIKWNDGTYDVKRICDECGLTTCHYPVHTDYYKEIVISKSYRNWLEGNNVNKE